MTTGQTGAEPPRKALVHALNTAARSLRSADVGLVAWLLAAVACLVLGYMLIWQRGPYFDDYANRLLARDLATGQWRPLFSQVRCPDCPMRALGQITTTTAAGLLPNHEFLIRSVATLIVGLSDLLFGLLIYRVLRSRLAAVVSTAFFLMPFYAAEAILWAGSAWPMCALFAMLSLNALWSALTQPTHQRPWFVVGLASFTIMVFYGEAFVSAFALLPALALAYYLQAQGPPDWALVRRSLKMLLCLAAVLVLVYIAGYSSGTPNVQERGGISADLPGVVERSRGYLNKLVWMFTSRGWAWPLTKEILHQGLHVIRHSWAAAALLAGAAGLCLVAIRLWRRDEQDNAAPARAGVLVLVAGVLWFFSTLLFPAALLKSNTLEYRHLYAPFAGLAMAGGALAWLVARRLGRVQHDRWLLALAALVMLVTSTAMLGYASAFAERSRLDQQQISALVEAVPAQYLPSGAVVVPVQPQEMLFGRGGALSRLLVGVLEAPWATWGALAVRYGRTDFQAITGNQWVPLSVEYTNDQQSSQLRIQGSVVAVERTVPFTYRDGRVYLIESFTVRMPDDSQRVVDFPLARDLIGHGAASIRTVAVRGP